jgi:tagatose-6-phosphate ketose/aldose isomerase
MIHYLSMPENILKEQTAYWTAREITQQPETWQKVLTVIKQDSDKLDAWLEPILKIDNLRIIMTGAGTSAYIGEALAPYLTQTNGRVFEAISSTDLVSCPTEYLVKSRPTLVISYGRSGDSPESVAAIEVVGKCADICYHLSITCNEHGALSKFAEKSKNAYNLLMPSETLDKSFAMTSSFTSMLVATLCVFARDEQQLTLACAATKKVIDNKAGQISAKATAQSKRFVFLGSGSMLGFSKEASLKLLELSAGLVDCYSESSLGFRHGPKSLVNKQTEIIVMDSLDKVVCQYDGDMIEELISDDIAYSITRMSDEVAVQHSELKGAWLGLPYIVYWQIFAFYKSINLSVTPDNPCPTGEVNRVVAGVNIYPQPDKNKM